MREQDLVNTIIQYIQWIGGVAIRINSGMLVIEGNYGRQRAFRGAPTGTSDILACIEGKFFAIECKLPGNKPTQNQKEFLFLVEAAGGRAMVAYSLEDVIQEIAIAHAQTDRTDNPPGE